jgi:hypothetical protein
MKIVILAIVIASLSWWSSANLESFPEWYSFKAAIPNGTKIDFWNITMTAQGSGTHKITSMPGKLICAFNFMDHFPDYEAMLYYAEPNSKSATFSALFNQGAKWSHANKNLVLPSASVHAADVFYDQNFAILIVALEGDRVYTSSIRQEGNSRQVFAFTKPTSRVKRSLGTYSPVSALFTGLRVSTVKSSLVLNFACFSMPNASKPLIGDVTIGGDVDLFHITSLRDSADTNLGVIRDGKNFKVAVVSRKCVFPGNFGQTVIDLQMTTDDGEFYSAYYGYGYYNVLFKTKGSKPNAFEGTLIVADPRTGKIAGRAPKITVPIQYYLSV